MFRSKWMALVLVGVVATAAAAAPLGVSAASGFRHGPLADTPLGKLISGHVGRLLVLRSELNVTDEQKAQIRDTLKSHRAEILVEAKQVWEKRAALRDAVLADQTDEAAIRKAADELGSAIGDAAVLAAKLRGEVAPVLTDDQRQLIRECRGDCHQATEAFFQKAVSGE